MRRDALSLVLVPFVTGLAVCCFGLFSFSWWFGEDQLSASLSKHLPGADGVPKEIAQNRGKVKIGEFFKKFSAVGSAKTVSEHWPAFRGLQQSNIYQSDKKLIDSFSADVPRQLWEIDLGEGHAAPAIYGGCMYFLD